MVPVALARCFIQDFRGHSKDLSQDILGKVEIMGKFRLNDCLARLPFLKRLEDQFVSGMLAHNLVPVGNLFGDGDLIRDSDHREDTVKPLEVTP
mgnify:CR=1 FL=1